MPLQFAVEKSDLVVIRISGQLSIADLERTHGECESVIKNEGRIKILVVLKNFIGWDKAKGWEDISFAQRNDPYIIKMAIVGDAKWQDLVYAFTGKGQRKVPIEYFDVNQEEAARQWLDIVKKTSQ